MPDLLATVEDIVATAQEEDVDAIGLVNLINRLNHGLDLAGNAWALVSMLPRIAYSGAMAASPSRTSRSPMSPASPD